MKVSCFLFNQKQLFKSGTKTVTFPETENPLNANYVLINHHFSLLVTYKRIP